MAFIVSIVKKTAQTILPSSLFDALVRYRRRIAVREDVRRYGANCSTQEIFTKIYSENTWGQPSDPSQKYYSGNGSHSPLVVDTYVKSLSDFLRSFDKQPDVVDLGCGDFCVGSRIREFCGNYTACDIVEPLIALNKEKYKILNVDFRVLDLTKDELPSGDVLLIRQVLQHLSNKQIKNALSRISPKYKYFVLTEHLSSAQSFVPNLDLPTGPGIRVEINSGIVITSKPFNFRAMEENTLCEVLSDDDGGIIRTIAYRLH